MKINAREIIALGYEEGKQIGLALQAVEEYPQKEQAFLQLAKVLEKPEDFLQDAHFSNLARELIVSKAPKEENVLRKSPLAYKIYGKEGIEAGALQQIDTAMKLPIARGGALMPDAHQGYGLPIGGVLATENAVIPYAVGVDIGCRMCMSIYDFPSSVIKERKSEFKKMLLNNTKFGREAFTKPKDHEVLENKLFSEVPVVRQLKDRAFEQIGSSGGGNHFVEFGEVEILDPDNEWGILPGKYLAVLSHSGSRGLGANIARYYTNLAMNQCKLPREAKHLAWLDLDTEEGQEYWLAMNLAGEYASACHHQIHERMVVGLRATPLAMIENHHNFAWKEQDEAGNEVIVHRKGATPASKGVLGIIPGSMTDPGFIVRGKGDPLSLNSAAHGAGRLMSRTAAKKSLQKNQVTTFLQSHGVEVIGSGLDEAPMVYKNIHEVMNYQEDLVEVVGTFQPKIVRMCGDKKFHEVD